MMTAEQTRIEPLSESRRIEVLPDIAVRLVLGAKASKTDDGVVVTLEKDPIRMHEKDFDLAVLVARQVKRYWKEPHTASKMLELVSYALKYLLDELFKPGLTRVIYYPCKSAASAFYRCVGPAFVLSRGKKSSGTLAANNAAAEAIPYDVVVIQLDHAPVTQQFVRSLQSMGKAVVYDIDDAFDRLEPWHPQNEVYGQPQRQDWVRAMMDIADAVTVSTENLKSRYADFSKRIEVIPNLIDYSIWPKAEQRPGRPFTVLWAGSPSHGGDLSMVSSVLSEFAVRHPDAQFVFFGSPILNLDISGGRVKILPFVPYHQYPHQLASVDADVALAPIADIPFNHAKSPVKVMEYWATGYPVIASDVGPYRIISHGSDGALCQTEKHWTDALEGLYADPDLRRKFSEAGRLRAAEFDFTRHVERIEDFYASLRKE
jgi:glycosyltransferase involved in cell wall biosynthesis